jgi:hypothetical protein
MPTKVSELENDLGYITEIPEFPELPTKVSDLENDLGYITEIPDIPTKVSELENDTGYLTEIPDEYTTRDFVEAQIRPIKYEVKPVKGMFIDYRDSEIRLNTTRVELAHQPVGPEGDPNSYYVEFRAYAPVGATSFKEWRDNDKDETLYTFDDDFAGTDELGRNYSVIWLPIANFDGAIWEIFGNASTVDKYLGFYYNFEWYNEANELIDTGKARIILTNDDCHNDLVPDAIARRIDEKFKAVEHPTVDLTGYATETFVREAIADAELDGEGVDLSIYATKDFVDEKIAAIEIPTMPTSIILFGGNANPAEDE